MNTETNSPKEKVWAMIDEERRRDYALQRISKTAWIVTIVIVVAYGVLTGVQVREMIAAAVIGTIPMSTAIGMAFPFIVVLGMVSLLIATVTTIGTFLRLRTTSLHEIQLRLAALEEMIASRSESGSFKA